jgi:UDP-N-acetylglucosamine diphosphorylase/glucosamine-1-phosphate N-acetyltransferase
MRICLYEDRHAGDLAPLTLTRPVFDLLCGTGSLETGARRAFAPDAVGYVVRPAVADLIRERQPHAPVNDVLWLRGGPTVLVNARWLPPARAAGDGPPTTRALFAGGPFVAVCGGEVAFAAVTPELLAEFAPSITADFFDDWLSVLPRQEVGGTVVRRPWDLLDANGARITADFASVCDAELAGSHPAGVAVVGPADRLSLDPSAVVEPQVVIDTTPGPVVIAAGAVVTAFTRLEGPCFIGPNTHVLGARVKGGCSFGPHCRVGGEVEASIVQGYANKAHVGFLGHSFVGEWVNLAAGTQTADLRNDYRPVGVPGDGGLIDTGRLKVGSFIGDHARTGLGVLLNCGTSIGAFAGLLPTGRLMPRDVPSFTRVGPDGMIEEPDLDALFATADRVMRRRGRSLTRAQAALYRTVVAQTAAHRRRTLGGATAVRSRRVA